MATLSVCLIVKNEEDVIERCLTSLTSFADEICVYDTGSTDNTVNICRSIDKVKLVEGEWRDDFSWARNQSFQMATGDYIMGCDADDVIPQSCQDFLNDFKNKAMSHCDVFYMKYRYHVDENDHDLLHFFRERIFKRILYPIGNGRIHETAKVTAKPNPTVAYMPEECYINHLKVKDAGNRNLNIFRDMETKNEIYRGRDGFYFGNELLEHKRFEEALEKYNKCLNTPETWNIERLNAALRSSLIYKDKQNYDKALELAYIAASCTSRPRADVCCVIGDIYRTIKNFEGAKRWYEGALDNNVSGLDATFYDEDCASWKPRLNLCLCEYELGNKKKAIRYNNEVLRIDPNNKDALNNKKILEGGDK